MFRKNNILLLLVLFISSCASHNQKPLQPLSELLDSTKGVLVSIPEDGWYKNTTYNNSGKMTANAFRTAFRKHSSTVDVTDSCKGKSCLNDINTDTYRYYILPEIINWEDRTTAWSGRPDRIEVELSIFDASTKKQLASTSIKAKSSKFALGANDPQDLLQKPINQYVSSLYEDQVKK